METGFSDFRTLLLLLFSCSSQNLGGSLGFPGPVSHFVPLVQVLLRFYSTPSKFSSLLWGQGPVLSTGESQTCSAALAPAVLSAGASPQAGCGLLSPERPARSRRPSAPARTCCLPHLSSPARAYRRAGATRLRQLASFLRTDSANL